jgi:hypothetical protein
MKPTPRSRVIETKERKIVFRMTDVVWAEMAVDRKRSDGSGHTLPTEKWHALMRFMLEKEIFPCTRAGGSGPSYLYGGFSRADADKLEKWLEENGATNEGEGKEDDREGHA